ncbi:MAG: endonuclease III [Candidatus Marinimicrobia bacterium]|nr:endonuclease III [Candidatus Neomarinimicrobiota bacterium]
MAESLEKKAIEIYNRLNTNYPNAACSLNHKDPVQLLVSTILSAQCTDKQVNKITPKLFEKCKTPEDFVRIDMDELMELIKPAGFFKNKAKAVKESMQIIVKDYNGNVPRSLEELIKLPGVGRKTANVVLGDGYGIPSIVVDTHVKRISRRLGLTNEKDPVKIEFDLMKIFPEDTWIKLGHLMIDHGRKVCNARNPKCEVCFLEDLCDFYNKRDI